MLRGLLQCEVTRKVLKSLWGQSPHSSTPTAATLFPHWFEFSTKKKRGGGAWLEYVEAQSSYSSRRCCHPRYLKSSYHHGGSHLLSLSDLLPGWGRGVGASGPALNTMQRLANKLSARLLCIHRLQWRRESRTSGCPRAVIR